MSVEEHNMQIARLEQRVARLENAEKIREMLEVEQSPEVKGLLKALKQLPQMAPYTILDDET